MQFLRQAVRPALIVFTLCLMIADLTSCLARRRVITRKGGTTEQTLITADKQTLVARIKETYESVKDLNATVDMVPALGSANKGRITEYKDVRAYILFRKPADIRIIGLYPVVRNKAFDMTSNGADFRLYIPAKNRFVTGKNDLIAPAANKLENLRPQHFLSAMLIEPPQANHETALLENYTDEDNAAYILHLVKNVGDGDLELSRTVWFNRLNLQIVRQIILDSGGDILTDARYSDWQTYDGVPFPKHIEINRPKDEYGVVITVVKMDINKGLTADKFVLEQPEGSQLQVLGQPFEEKKPAAASAPPAPKGKRKK